MLSAAEFAERARSIRLLVADVDGVLTAGSIVVDDAGHETKLFSVRDGFGIRCWQRAGHRVAVITGRCSTVVARRCRELGIDPVIQNAHDKTLVYSQLLQDLGLTSDDVCYIGDDLPDLPLLLASGIGASVADGEELVRLKADWVCQRGGGQGAVRELIEQLLTAQGHWQSVVEHYSRPAGH